MAGGILINTADVGPLVLVHEVFDSFTEPEKEMVRRYAALAVRGQPHEAIVAALRSGCVGKVGFTQALVAVRRAVRSLDPTVLFSPDGVTRVQLGSMSRTTKDILREGLQGDHLFILPASLFEGKTNYADIEFLVYLNFFLRQKTRTRIVGTSRQWHVLHRLLTLTLFGLFDPAALEPPSFEQLDEAYGVGSRETYDFLRTAHELYGARRDGGVGSPLLGIDAYVEFFALDGEATVISLPTAEVLVTPSGRGFDVRITQPDGRSSEKKLEVSTPPQVLRHIPPEVRETIQFASERPRFGVTPLGTSHGFDAAVTVSQGVVVLGVIGRVWPLLKTPTRLWGPAVGLKKSTLGEVAMIVPGEIWSFTGTATVASGKRSVTALVYVPGVSRPGLTTI